MTKPFACLSLSLCLSATLPTLAHANPEADSDGFTHPLSQLQFNPFMDQQAFERAGFEVLDVYDPWTGPNRRIYQFNQRADEWIIMPVVRGYRYVTPDLAQQGISNFFSNVGDIGNLLNSAFQLKGQRSMEITARLLINTTLGAFGLWDPASKMGAPKHHEDFGQTLGHYGVGAGPYVVLPFLGPSNLRDAGGTVVDFASEQGVDFLNVATASSANPAISVLRAVDLRSGLPFEYGQTNSPFEYEKVRFLYNAARKIQIAD
ncbi:MlaA family lipoprotein [Atopomonas sediminilitoris]|uniref:MlaA family lipoprotein n=1 Tax=Atopomonas sediminilitoris TaxID=2919919 RepID=UPI001F4E1720|nr:VacJ family lipoprotein [Atopomonas sediminilitoris]MCJ8170081.1 VacJ family lipoprotein [Atopomonas sediminilitoris]